MCFPPSPSRSPSRPGDRGSRRRTRPSRSTTRIGSWAVSPPPIDSNTPAALTETDMNVHMRPTVTPEAEETLEDLADSLAIPESRYEQAERSYKALGEWLNRPESSIRQFDPQV